MVFLKLDSVGGWVFGFLFGFPALLLFIGLILRNQWRDANVSLSFSVVKGAKGKEYSDKVDGYHVGAMESSLSPNYAVGVLGLLLLLLGSQTGLLYFTADHLGLGTDPSLLDCFAVSTDNYLHGILLDVCELYGLSVAMVPKLEFWPATVFLAYRLTADGLVLLLLYLGYRWWTIRGLVQDLEKATTPAILVDCLRKACGHTGHWLRQFPDEFIFLAIVEHYLRSDDDMVRKLGEQFPHLRISNKVRSLFVADDGTRLLPDSPEPVSGDQPVPQDQPQHTNPPPPPSPTN